MVGGQLRALFARERVPGEQVGNDEVGSAAGRRVL
jgi:hypothetical protein